MAGYAVYNPLKKDYSDLPVIYGFNNGGEPGFYYAQLIAEDGTALGSHLCSNEYFMFQDLGILEGCRPDRHETFRKHYPDGYRMAFVTYKDVPTHIGLTRALENNSKLREAEENTIDSTRS